MTVDPDTEEILKEFRLQKLEAVEGRLEGLSAHSLSWTIHDVPKSSALASISCDNGSKHGRYQKADKTHFKKSTKRSRLTDFHLTTPASDDPKPWTNDEFLRLKKFSGLKKSLKKTRSEHSDIALARLAEWVLPGRTLSSINRQKKNRAYLEYLRAHEQTSSPSPKTRPAPRTLPPMSDNLFSKRYRTRAGVLHEKDDDIGSNPEDPHKGGGGADEAGQGHGVGVGSVEDALTMTRRGVGQGRKGQRGEEADPSIEVRCAALDEFLYAQLERTEEEGMAFALELARGGRPWRSRRS